MGAGMCPPSRERVSNQRRVLGVVGTLSEGSKIQFLFAAADKQHNEDIEISDILLIDDYPGKFTQYQKLLRILASCFNHQKWILFRPSHVASCDFADLSVTFDTYYVCSSSEVWGVWQQFHLRESVSATQFQLPQTALH